MVANRLTIEPSPKRMRVVLDGETVADSIATLLVIEDFVPVHYFPRADLRMDLLRPSHKRTRDAKGEAHWWSAAAGGELREDVAWSYARPDHTAELIKDHVAFDWDAVDHWLEEDEEIFGHPRDPHHRIDVRPSSRLVEVLFAGETIASTRRGLFLFETGMPPRHYIPAGDVRIDLLTPSSTVSICPYKGTASYWHLHVGDRVIEDAVWAYLDPLPDCRRIREHFCFYPEKIDHIEVERPRIAVPAVEETLAAATI